MRSKIIIGFTILVLLALLVLVDKQGIDSKSEPKPLNKYEIVYTDDTCDTVSADGYYESYEQIVFFIGSSFTDGTIKTISLFNMKSVTLIR